ncbi:MAG: ThuA domain-containing protein [Acidimicrobiia bacterium]
MADRLLFVTQVAPYRDGPAGVHGVLDQAAVGVSQVAELHGLATRRVDDVRTIEAAALRDARALALFTIGETPWSAEQKSAIVGGLRAGRLSLLSIHSATDSCYTWAEYSALVGARFDGHPWTQTFTADVLDPSHPACAHLGAEWKWHDEVYQFRDLRPDAQVLLRVRDGELDLTAPGARPPSFGYPLAWCFSEGEGRVFSTSLGHFPGAWEAPAYLRHLVGGLGWALGANGEANWRVKP